MPALAWVFLHFGALRSRGSELFQVRCIQLFGIFGRRGVGNVQIFQSRIVCQQFFAGFRIKRDVVGQIQPDRSDRPHCR